MSDALEQAIIDTARICHETNAAYCRAIGDHSQVPWDDAPEWQKQSAISGVRYHINTPNSNAGDSHRNWMAEKMADGWRYGPVKDPALKQHPCIVPFHELPPEQQAKDHIFLAIVRSRFPGH